MVVPSDEPIGAALPGLLELLGEPEGTVARPLTLVHGDGEQVDLARTPEQLDLRDGTALRLVRLDTAPPPPVVIDVVDVAADSHVARRDRWDERARMGAGSAIVALASAAAGALVPLEDPPVAMTYLALAMLALLALAAGVGWARQYQVATTCSAAAAGLVLPFAGAAWAAAGSEGFEAREAATLGVATALAAGAFVVLVGAGGALRGRGAVAGGVLGLLLAGLSLGMVLAGVPAGAAVAVTGVIAAFATGPLPWIALSAAGLDALDRRVADGQRVVRPKTEAAVDDAYDGLTWSIAAVAATLTVSGVVLSLAGGVWNVLLAVAFGLTAVLRARAFPLRAQVWLLLVPSVTIGLVLIVTHLATASAWLAVALLAGGALLVATAVLVRPAPHTRARLRGWGNVVETIAVVSLLPLLLGAFGVYDDLLGMFSG